jgi:CRISPR/Cas system-associated endonuclease Cas1
VGYLHEFIGCQTKQSLVYDLQEPFRWIADVAVMEAFESGVLDLPDFYFTGGDYRLRMKPPLLDRYVELLREQFKIPHTREMLSSPALPPLVPRLSVSATGRILQAASPITMCSARGIVL